MYKRWYIGFNDYWYTASIYLEEVSIGFAFLESLSFWICHFIPPIKLPKIKFKLKNKDDWDWTENKNGWTDLQEWYVDIGQLWHLFVCVPISHLRYKYTKTKIIDLPFNFALEKFPDEYVDYYDDFTDDLIERKKNKKIADEFDERFKEIYDKLNCMNYKY